jgi:predicted RNase H-like nuclease (RuvC/YqgF family)
MEIIPCSNEKREREFGRVYLNLPLYRDRHNRLFVIIKGKYEEIQKSYSGYEFLRDNIDVSSVSTFKTFELEQEIKNLKKENEMQSETLAKVKEWYKDTVAKKDQEILELKNQIERLTLNN